MIERSGCLLNQAFDKFELEDISQIHKERKHIEKNEVYEETLYHRAIDTSASVEEQVENKLINDELRKAINKLSDVQKRRIKMYYFEGLTQQQIADREHTSIRAIQYTLNDSMRFYILAVCFPMLPMHFFWNLL